MSRTTSFILAGGENHYARPVEVQPGELLFSENYEPAVGGGYRLMDGFERYDGRPAPSTGADSTEIESLRTAIQAVPGEGPVRGVWVYDGDVYAFRDNVGQTACKMYKATGSGWSEVTTGVVLNPGGKYRFVNYNFYGSASTVHMYGVDGQNPAFEFDGTTFTQLTNAGMSPDTPLHIAAHVNRLFLGYANGSLQYSAVGDPSDWSGANGAGEIAVGDEITALLSMVGATLGVWNRNSTYLLYGSSTSDFDLRTHDADSGCLENSLANLGGPKYLDDRGLVAFDPSDRFGDFAGATFSQKVNTLLHLYRSDVVASLPVRQKDQFRLFRSDGYGLITSIASGRPEFTRFNLGVGINCVCSGELTAGTEVLFAGSTDGYVYQLDSGTSFDGNPIVAYLRLAFNHVGSPQRKKRFRKVTIDFDAESPTSLSLSFSPDFDYSNVRVATSRTDAMALSFNTISLDPIGGYWGFAEWSDFYWSSPAIGQFEGYVDGTGVNFGLVIRSESTYEPPHTLRSVGLQYDIRGLDR